MSDYAALDFALTCSRVELLELIDALEMSRISTPTTKQLIYRLKEALEIID